MCFFTGLFVSCLAYMAFAYLDVFPDLAERNAESIEQHHRLVELQRFGELFGEWLGSMDVTLETAGAVLDQAEELLPPDGTGEESLDDPPATLPSVIDREEFVERSSASIVSLKRDSSAISTYSFRDGQLEQLRSAVPRFTEMLLATLDNSLTLLDLAHLQKNPPGSEVVVPKVRQTLSVMVSDFDIYVKLLKERHTSVIEELMAEINTTGSKIDRTSSTLTYFAYAGRYCLGFVIFVVVAFVRYLRRARKGFYPATN